MPWQRIITALVLLPLALYAIYFLPLDTFCVVVAMIVLIGFWEWSGFITAFSYLSRILYVLTSAAIMWFVYKNSFAIEYWNAWLIPINFSELFQLRDAAFISVLLSLVWWVIAAVLVIIFPKMSQIYAKNMIVMSLLGWIILIPTWIALTGIRSISIYFDYFRGSDLLLFSMLLVWAADTGAFVSGKLLGKHKLAPKLSPKKTWEGVLGGAILALVLAILGANILDIQQKHYLGLAILSITVVSFSVIGDLTESIFKRVSGKKDSGAILPGHGGILDRIDGLTATLPICLFGFIVLGIN